MRLQLRLLIIVQQVVRRADRGRHRVVQDVVFRDAAERAVGGVGDPRRLARGDGRLVVAPQAGRRAARVLHADAEAALVDRRLDRHLRQQLREGGRVEIAHADRARLAGGHQRLERLVRAHALVEAVAGPVEQQQVGVRQAERAQRVLDVLGDVVLGAALRQHTRVVLGAENCARAARHFRRHEDLAPIQARLAHRTADILLVSLAVCQGRIEAAAAEKATAPGDKRSEFLVFDP